ncbi:MULTISPECIES: hypothetical protein [Burkholderia]|uniref:hypothetical protein n=1 Tax=Burkholderia TaxID=32008 RepID=UPI00158DD008|nr:hypothetical protein [Burkholderia cepacia]MCA7934794.1 hypothetical protein [Burkholderia cepacia]MCA8056543.1 hypothetical protein [Burkholderia cepacia]MCA8134678.1 hypothetical protein [Burkholderia cepacia]MCA8164419.1 hypothetical protein [Burkholderia cepacia]MDN7617949.1 hypothetical protein [Burkholderia cepacia]
MFDLDLMMIWGFVFLAVALMSNSVFAKSACSDLLGEQISPSLNTKVGAVCFVRKPMLDNKTGAPIGLDGISLYYAANGNVPVEAEGRGLLYDDTPGEIVDALSMRVGRDRQEKVFVIHSFEVRYSLMESNSSGRFYSVSVFEPIGDILHQDERSTEWFGVGYSWLSDGQKRVWKFPYQSRKDVRQALDSHFASLMSEGEGIPVRVKSKTYLFDGSSIRNKKKIPD